MSVAQKPQAVVKLDGRTLEGGGQLLRVALCLSSLTGVPIHVSHIRGKRGAGKVGGLKPAHLAAVQWLAKATAATTEGMEVRSTELLFKPTISIDQNGLGCNALVWKDIYAKGSLILRETHIPMSTAGSILLILQAILPYALYLPSSVPLNITVEGGTNVSNSPSIDYVSQVLLPLLATKLGIQPIGVEVHKRGWSAGRSEVGSVTFKITTIKKGSTLPAFHLKDRGPVEKVHISVIAPDDGSRERIKQEALRQTGEAMPHAESLLAVDEVSGRGQHIYLLLVAETSSGFRLGRDCLFARKALTGHYKRTERTVEEEDARMVTSVVRELQRELSWEGSVDEYMEDQLVVFQALARGVSEVNAGTGREASLHTKTARWVAEETLGTVFVEGKCHGVGLRIGEAPDKEAGAQESDIAQSVEQLRI